MKIRVPVAKKGEFPHPAGVTQVIDDIALDAIANTAIPEGGLLCDFDHYSDLTAEEREAVKQLGIALPSNASGWATSLSREGDTVWATVNLTKEGEDAVTSKAYAFSSPVFPAATLDALGDCRVRPRSLKKIALTNEPNMRALGGFVLKNRGSFDLDNREKSAWQAINGTPERFDEMADNEKQQPKENKTMKDALAKILNVDAAAEDAVFVDAVSALADANKALEAENAKLLKRAEEAEAKLEEAALNDKINEELDKHDLPNREAAEKLLRANFESGAAFLATLDEAKKDEKKQEVATVRGADPSADLSNREAGKQPIDRIAELADFIDQNV